MSTVNTQAVNFQVVVGSRKGTALERRAYTRELTAAELAELKRYVRAPSRTTQFKVEFLVMFDDGELAAFDHRDVMRTGVLA